MSSRDQMSEWMKIMLEEIEQKNTEAEEAAEEASRRAQKGAETEEHPPKRHDSDQ